MQALAAAPKAPAREEFRSSGLLRSLNRNFKQTVLHPLFEKPALKLARSACLRAF